jgi:hypothetical protein
MLSPSSTRFSQLYGRVERGGDRADRHRTENGRRQTIHQPPVNGVSYDDFNRFLHAEAATNSHFRLVQWDRMVDRDPGMVAGAGEGIHPDGNGYRLRAAAFTAQLAACARTLTQP